MQLSDLSVELGRNQEITQRKLRYLSDRLNFCHFQGQDISIVLKHRIFNRLKVLTSKVFPTAGSEVLCQPQNKGEAIWLLERFQVYKVSIQLKNACLDFFPAYIYEDSGLIRLGLPEECFEISASEITSRKCTNVQGQIVCDHGLYTVVPLEFSASKIKVVLPWEEYRILHWTPPKEALWLVLYSEHNTYFSGKCQVQEEQETERGLQILLSFPQEPYARFRPRKFRSQRLQITPPPDIVFSHPLSQESLSFKIHDISGRGFSFLVPEDKNLFFPRLTIPHLEIRFGLYFSVTCTTHLVYCIEHDAYIRCGACFMDIDLESITKIICHLHQLQDNNAYVMNQYADPEKLWEFFFSTGFIYPQKYYHISNHAQDLKTLYAKLYSGTPSITRHFTYQEHGDILAHISMLRMFDRSWLIHHHAADKASSRLAGVKVLSQISHYVNEVHTFESAKMDYVMCFYRPDNKFPARVFGGVARKLRNRDKCSLDTFAYISSIHGMLPGPTRRKFWIDIAHAEDIKDFLHLYKQISNGLLPHTFNFIESDELFQSYASNDLNRSLKTYVLQTENGPAAIVLLLMSDVGLNMSDVTHCMYFFAIQYNEIDKDLINKCVLDILQKENAKDTSLMLFPECLAKHMNIKSEKRYTLWILNLKYLDEYFQYCTRLFGKF
jgi:hypothetical protein